MVAKPAVGSTIEVVSKSTLYSHLPIWSPSLYTYKGKVVADESFDPPDHFRLTGDTPWHPVRLISLASVQSIQPYDGPIKDPYSREYLQPKTAKFGGVQSQEPDEVHIVQGSKGKHYEVTKKGNRGWHCTCPGFAFHKGRCKHLDLVIQAINK